MGRILLVALALIVISMVTACSSSADKWTRDNSTAAENSDSNWQKDGKPADSTRKASSSSWKDEGRY